MSTAVALLGVAGSARTASAQAPAAAADRAAVDLYQVGQGHFKLRRWKLAAASFETFLKKYSRHPRVPLAQFYLGLARVHLEQFAPARDVLRQFARVNPKNKNLPVALYRIAECSYLLDDLKSANVEFRAFLKQHPQHELGEWALPNLADTQLRQKQYTVAEATYRRALARFPKGRLAADARLGLARSLEAQDKRDEARKVYRAMSADARFARGDEALVALGALEFDAGRFAEAAEAYGQLPKRFPTSRLLPLARLNAGFALYGLKDYAAAIKWFEQARQATGQAATADYWIGVCHKSAGEYAAAVAAFGRAAGGRPDPALEREIALQWADAELRNGNVAAAQKRYLEVVRRWPKDQVAERSLLLAAEAALMVAVDQEDQARRKQQLDDAISLVAWFARDYPDSGLLQRHRLLEGRVLLARGRVDDRKRARDLFLKVLTESKNEAMRQRARFHFARIAQQQGDHAAVTRTLAPVLVAVRRERGGSEFVDALVLDATSQLSLKKYDRAFEASGDYLDRRPTGTLAADALAIQALAAAGLGRHPDADRAVFQLIEDFRQSPVLGRTLQQMADMSYQDKKWARSIRLFAALVELGPTSPFHAAGLSGLGWSRFQTGRYGASASAFRQVVDSHGKHELAPEAGYMQGEALAKAGKSDEALAAFRSAATTFGTHRYAFLAGRRVARLLTAAKRYDQADQAYRDLLKRFPAVTLGGLKPREKLDTLLYEWAMANYDAERFEQANAAFARLVREVPSSELADDARYCLAENDLVAGRLQPAAAAFRKLADDPRTDDDIRRDSLYRLVGIAAEQRRWDAVRASADELEAKFPNSEYSWEVRFQRGQAELHAGRPAAARDLLVPLTRLRDNAAVSGAAWFLETWVLLAKAHFELKAYDQVEAVVADLRRYRPKAGVLYKADEMLGRARSKRPRPDFAGAREAFRRVILSPTGRRTRTAASCHLRLADTFFTQKNYREAVKEFLEVHILYKFPEFQAPALYYAGLSYEQLRASKSAAETYELLLKDFPDDKRYGPKARSRLAAIRGLPK